MPKIKDGVVETFGLGEPLEHGGMLARFVEALVYVGEVCRVDGLHADEDPTNLADVTKGFNNPGEYAAVLQRLARRNVYAITSFIFGMDNDTVGVAERTLKEIHTWPAGLPIFGLLTPLPATPLYKRLEAAGRLTRPKHWQEFIPFEMAHTPLKMTIAEAHAEVKAGWAQAYSPDAMAQAVDSLKDKPLGYRINIFIARMCFRGIYFPQMRPLAWLKLFYL